MAFHQVDSLRYYSFDIFADQEVVHAIFTRRGGVSPLPWAELNMGASVGDEINRVQENRRRAFHALGLDPATLYDVYQVHSADVVCADAPRRADYPHLRADAILTDKPGVNLFMRFADCVPILLYDPVRRVVGIAHAGWQGTVKKILVQTVRMMQERYHCRAEDIHAGIGPSIGSHHYQVGAEVVEQVTKAFGEDSFRVLSVNEHHTVQFDLWKANRLLLEKAGVKNIQVASICTACCLEDWYSHRGEKGKTGRFGALIGLG